MSVEIISRPPGQAPEWVRDAWIGLILPVMLDTEEAGFQMGVHGGRPQNTGGFRVPTEEALWILEQSDEEAALWWYENLLLMPEWLVFSKAVCKLIEEE